jgi:hypothetical protein
MRVELQIDELVAPGVRAADARVLVRSAERELGRLVASGAEGGAAWPARADSRVAQVSAEVPASVSPAAAGAMLARTLYTELGR